jgi:hypothetical protein
MTPFRAAPLVLVLAAVCAAQQHPSTDPRDAKDPRTVIDPRNSEDPRGKPLPPGADQYAPLEGSNLYDAIYAAGDENRLVTAFKADGWNILGYIDKHCEGWLALLEAGEDKKEDGRAKIAAMQAKGRKLAAIADRALGDTRFTAYVENFYGWNPDQQKSFREGQALFHQAETVIGEADSAQAMLAAVTPLRQSIDRSRTIGDTWGQSMALAALGRVQEQNNQLSEAYATMNDAVRLGREIRDLNSVWEGLGVQYEVSGRQMQYQPAKDALQDQYLIALDLKDEKVQQQVTHKMVELEQIFANQLTPH